MQQNSQNKSKQTVCDRRCAPSDAGFTLIEMIIALEILSIGLLGAAAVVAFALQTSAFSRNTTESKMMMSAMLEQVETLRNTGQLTFGQIANVNQVTNPPNRQPFTGFRTDFAPISTAPGADGVYGTADDGAADPNKTQYSRRVLISLVSPNNPYLKRVEVAVRYPGFNGKIRETSMSGYLNDDQRSNQR